MLTWTNCVVFARLSLQRKASAVVLSSLFKSKVSSQSSQNSHRRVRTKWIRQQSLPVYLCLNLGRLLAASEVGGGGCFLLSLQMKGSGSIIETSAFLEKHTGPAWVKEGSINRLHIYTVYVLAFSLPLAGHADYRVTAGVKLHSASVRVGSFFFFLTGSLLCNCGQLVLCVLYEEWSVNSQITGS